MVIPCYNERATIPLLLAALQRQSYPLEDMEVIVADGLSTDGTPEAIAAFQREHPSLSVRLIQNPRRSIPAALNRGIKAARGEYIVRLDAHSIPADDYVEKCIAALAEGKGANVGGVWEIRPGQPGWIGRSIAAAAAHPLGVGDARYRYSNTAGVVDTVPFGAFRKDIINQIGEFDETLLTNEDYEFNVRIRQTGGIIWLDPAIRSTYFARGSLGALARQYLRYGYWKGRVLRRYPRTLRWRQALPPLFVLGLAGLTFLSLFLPFARWGLLISLGIYLLALFLVGLQTALQHKDRGLLPGMPLAMATMHLCWGGALLGSLFTGWRLTHTNRVKPEK